MSITVVIQRDDVGKPCTREVYETAAKFVIENSELTIVGSDNGRPQMLAMYGSGNWLSVYFDDSVTVISEKPAEDDTDDFSFGDDDSSDTSFGDDDSSDSTFDADDSDVSDDESESETVGAASE